eukprot:266400_1
MSGENTDPRLVETQEEKDRLQREFDALDEEYRNSLRRSSAERINSGARDMDENALSTHNLETDAKFSVQDSALPNVEPDVVEFCLDSCSGTRNDRGDREEAERTRFAAQRTRNEDTLAQKDAAFAELKEKIERAQLQKEKDATDERENRKQQKL